MTEKHTPGPWEAAIQHRCHAVIASISGEPKAVAIVGNNNPDDGNEPMRFANARLIAAAPDLLSALTELMASAGENITRESDKSLAAILDEPDCPDEAKRQIMAFLIARAAIAKTMLLPPPCGTMTVTYEIDRKVKIPVFNESALRSFAEEAQKKDVETIQELIGSLERVMSWINNWEPDFSEDADWRSDARDIRAAILKAKRDQQ